VHVRKFAHPKYSKMVILQEYVQSCWGIMFFYDCKTKLEIKRTPISVKAIVLVVTFSIFSTTIITSVVITASSMKIWVLGQVAY